MLSFHVKLKFIQTQKHESSGKINQIKRKRTFRGGVFHFLNVLFLCFLKLLNVAPQSAAFEAPAVSGRSADGQNVVGVLWKRTRTLALRNKGGENVNQRVRHRSPARPATSSSERGGWSPQTPASCPPSGCWLWRRDLVAQKKKRLKAVSHGLHFTHSPRVKYLFFLIHVW